MAVTQIATHRRQSLARHGPMIAQWTGRVSLEARSPEAWNSIPRRFSISRKFVLRPNHTLGKTPDSNGQAILTQQQSP